MYTYNNFTCTGDVLDYTHSKLNMTASQSTLTIIFGNFNSELFQPYMYIYVKVVIQVHDCTQLTLLLLIIVL